MSGWKVLAATPFLLVPPVALGISVADGPEHTATTPTMVLPRPDPTPPAGPTPERPAPAGPAPERPGPDPGRDCAEHDDARDDDADEGVESVHPCPGAVGDDEDDDDSGDDGGDDSADDEGDD